MRTRTNYIVTEIPHSMFKNVDVLYYCDNRPDLAEIDFVRDVMVHEWEINDMDMSVSLEYLQRIIDYRFNRTILSLTNSYVSNIKDEKGIMTYVLVEQNIGKIDRIKKLKLAYDNLVITKFIYRGK